MESIKTPLKKQLLELVLIRWKVKQTNEHWYGFCCSCKKFWHRTTMSGGHFIPQSKWDSCRFELDNTNLQCQTCNARCNQGEQFKHGQYINQTYNIFRADELHLQSRTPRKWKTQDLERAILEVENLIIERYKKQTDLQQKALVFYMKKNSVRKKFCKTILNNISS